MTPPACRGRLGLAQKARAVAGDWSSDGHCGRPRHGTPQGWLLFDANSPPPSARSRFPCPLVRVLRLWFPGRGCSSAHTRMPGAGMWNSSFGPWSSCGDVRDQVHESDSNSGGPIVCKSSTAAVKGPSSWKRQVRFSNLRSTGNNNRDHLELTPSFRESSNLRAVVHNAAMARAEEPTHCAP